MAEEGRDDIVVSTGTNFAKNIALYLPVGCVRSAIFIRKVDCALSGY